MKIALVMDASVIDNDCERGRLIDKLRQTQGVLKLDVDMAENGLLMADLSASTDLKKFEKVDGIAGVRALGTKHILVSQ